MQLADFGAVFPRAAILETVAPLALDLCTDPCAAPRRAARHALGSPSPTNPLPTD
tara:strand:- start:102 stop:266 length:165 start_codon:yes stop_codon:yes gene_type:complete